MRRVIVSADDFGHSTAVNDGIAEAHERGIVTSAGLMVQRPAAEAAAAYALAHPELSIGLHVDLGEWAYRHGEWEALYETPATGVSGAVAEQLDRFRSLLGRDPTHLDSHQHVHLREPARSTLSALAESLGVPVRHLDPRVSYCGRFYGQTETGDPLPNAIRVEALIDVLETLPEGTTEICCHPAKGVVPGSSYGSERERELHALCDPRVRATVAASGLALISFAEVT
jgi:predicted glycoside hydrolase/deacetylase ChbG (UPF0249 family)